MSADGAGETLAEHNGELIDGLPPGDRWHFQSFSMLRKARYSSLLAASSAGKWPRFLTILRNCMCMLSMALVEYPRLFLEPTPSRDTCDPRTYQQAPAPRFLHRFSRGNRTAQSATIQLDQVPQRE